MFDSIGIAAALRDDGFWFDAHAVEPSLCAALLSDLHSLDAAAELKPAGVGRATAYRRDERTRGDRIAWLTPATAAQRTLLGALDTLRVALNGSLFLGLASSEAHFANYAPGARYQRHLDRFPGARNRVVSLAIYLNTDWQVDDGGELILYTPEPLHIPPCAGTAVVFLSEDFEHEVAAATRDRASVAAWLRSG